MVSKQHSGKWVRRMTPNIVKRYAPVPKISGEWVVGGTTVGPCNELTACLYGFRHYKTSIAREVCFWRCSEILWDQPNGDNLVEYQPWSEKIIQKACANKYLAIGGAASSGKSHIMAAFGILQWMCAPEETLVLMTSTTLREARKRIWGSVIKLLSVIDGVPLKIRDSIGSANFVDEGGRVFDTLGLSLIAAERSKTREAIGKMIGIHTPRVILIGDELSELSLSIMEAGLSNLAANPYFQFIGLSNPASRFDAFGVWSEPCGGWDSIVVERDLEWKTKYGGEFIRLDAMDSPNVLFGEDLYSYLPTLSKINEARDNLGGENSRGFMRMFRAVFFDGDEESGIYSESEIASSGSLTKAIFKGPVIHLAAVDPSFSSNGDRTIMVTGSLGYDTNGQYSLSVDEVIPIYEDETNKAVPRTYQIARKIKDLCVARGISPEDLVIDSTAAGAPFCDVVAGEWSNQLLRVSFGGGASHRRVSASNRTPAKDLYVNRVSELWFVGKEFLRCRQFFGIPNEVAVDMTARTYEMVKGSNLRMKVEPKQEFKSRIGRSPDIADAMFLLIELARQRHSFVSIDLDPSRKDDMSVWTQQRRREDFDVASRSAHVHLLG
jgi:hypothetical protein